MASAQVQHDARVIGSLVAGAFPHFRKRWPASRNFALGGRPRPACRARLQPGRTSFHASGGMLPSRNEAGVPLHSAVYFPTSSQCSIRFIYTVLLSIDLVKNSLTASITEFYVVLPISNKMFQSEINRLYCLIHAALRKETLPNETGTGVPLSQMWHYYQGTIVC